MKKLVSEKQNQLNIYFYFFVFLDSGDGNEEKRLNKKLIYSFFCIENSFWFFFSRCQLLSCTTEKLGKKKNRKNRLRAFPTKWNELTEENREAIRRSLRTYCFFVFK
jgi:hypothetical protein